VVIRNWISTALNLQFIFGYLTIFQENSDSIHFVF
jgi:hypothetical protein